MLNEMMDLVIQEAAAEVLAVLVVGVPAGEAVVVAEVINQSI